MSFTFTGLSPSTPSRSKRSLFAQQQSTTPKVPPPSHLSHPSTTPLGPPPRSVFGSSQHTTSRPLFGIKNAATRGFHVPDSSPPAHGVYADIDEDNEGMQDAIGDEDHEAIMDAVASFPGRDAFSASIMSSPRGLKRSRNGKVRDSGTSNMASVARGYARQAARSGLLEPDALILEQEEIMNEVDTSLQKDPSESDVVLTRGVARISSLWEQYADGATKEGGLGPALRDGVTEATYVANLLLQLHHPHTSTIPPSHGQRSRAIVKPAADCPVPRALLDWLDAYHNPFPDEFEAIHLHQPSPADHERFWDTVYASIARGKLQQAVALLRDAGWDHAITALDDFPQTQPEGYSGRQLDYIETAVDWCLQVLLSCPAMTDNDWDVCGPDWAIYRQRIRQALKDLEQFAGTDADAQDNVDRGNVFQRSARVGERDLFSLSAASKRAESRVPWSVYESLKLVYGLLLGGVDELLDTSQDWLEASLYWTIWWDGEDEAEMKSRGSIGHGHQKPREVDVSPLVAYRNRLADAFDMVSADEELDPVFRVNTMDPVQVAVACVMEDAVDGAISILRTWSPAISTAVVELAALGGWLPQARPRSAGLIEQGFNSEDLMVLSHGPGSILEQVGETNRDEVLRGYAHLLAQKSQLTSENGRRSREGWELAVSVLGRLDNTSSAQQIIGGMLAKIELTDEDRVNRVLSACSDLDLMDQAHSIAERYADSLASSADSYGAALVFYARARAVEKLKSTLALLTTMCLIQSIALPNHVGLDPVLSSLLASDRAGLLDLASVDSEAAGLLSSRISGYATVRRFYELRDENATSANTIDGRAASSPLERKRNAATALLAVIESAADCIRGGLFDPAVDSIVPVDGLLVLFGEALPLLGQPHRVLTRDQAFALLRIVEDLATAPRRIRDRAGDLLRAAVGAYHSSSESESRTTAKSVPATLMAASESSYDMLASASALLAPSGTGDGRLSSSTLPGGSAAARAWDWRKGLDGLPAGVEVGRDEVLVLLRTALAQEVARGWNGTITW